MDTSNLSIELYHLQSNVIGLFKPKYSLVVEMVIDNDRGFLTTVYIGTLGGLITNYISASEGNLVMFDSGETLYKLLSNPFKLNDYVNKTIEGGAVNSVMDFIKNLEQWETLSGDEYSDMLSIMKNSLPSETKNSLHVQSNIYIIDGITYREMYAISDNINDSKPIIERLIE